MNPCHPLRRAPRDPEDRRAFVQELKRLYELGRLEWDLRPEDLPASLLLCLVNCAICGQLGIPTTMWQREVGVA